MSFHIKPNECNEKFDEISTKPTMLTMAYNTQRAVILVERPLEQIQAYAARASVALLEHIERTRVSSQMWLRIVHLVKWFISAVVVVAAPLLLLWLRFSSSNKSPVLLRNSAFNYEMMSCYVYVVHMCVYVGPASFYIHSTYTPQITHSISLYIIVSVLVCCCMPCHHHRRICAQCEPAK